MKQKVTKKNTDKTLKNFCHFQQTKKKHVEENSFETVLFYALQNSFVALFVVVVVTFIHHNFS